MPYVLLLCLLVYLYWGGWIDSFFHIVKLYVLYVPFYFFGVFFFQYKEKAERMFRLGVPLFFLMYIVMLGGLMWESIVLSTPLCNYGIQK